MGREETKERIIEAAIALMRNAGSSNISVRQIAEAAGVSHPLVLRYFGSKQGVIAACLTRLDPSQPRQRMTLPPYHMLETGMKASFQARTKTRSYVQLAVCSTADTDPGFDQAAGRDLLERLRAVPQRSVSLDAMEPIDPRVVAGAIAALSIGWLISERWLERTFELDGLGEDEMVEQLARLSACMGEMALPRREVGPQSDASSSVPAGQEESGGPPTG